jgi:HlyD family secretion protein
VIDVPNPQLKLKPGMTANVKVEIAKRTNVLRVPSAALRFRPTAEVFAALNQTPPPEATGSGRSGRGRGTGAGRLRKVPPQARGRRRAPSSVRAASSPETGARETGDAVGPQVARAGRGGCSWRTGRRSGAHDGTLQGMSPEEQQQFIARMKERGRDTSAFEAADARLKLALHGAASQAGRAAPRND